MLIVMTSDASESDIARVREAVEKMGWSAHALPGTGRTAVAITGNSGAIDPALFENLPGVAEAIRVTKPYKLSSDARSSGRSVSQRVSCRNGHRVWNRQPEGGFDGEGRSPVSRIRSRCASTSGSGTGTADMRAIVYGCRGRAYSSSGAPICVTAPSTRTASRSRSRPRT